MTPKERELVIYIRRQAVSAVKMANILLKEDSRASKAARKPGISSQGIHFDTAGSHDTNPFPPPKLTLDEG